METMICIITGGLHLFLPVVVNLGSTSWISPQPNAGEIPCYGYETALFGYFAG